MRVASYPVIIDSCHDDKLDAARRDTVISLLGSRGFHDTKRVMVACPEESCGITGPTIQPCPECSAGRCGR
jgi:hypothetical protein